MRLKYKILWIEDDESTIDSIGPRLIDFLDDLGFDLDYKVIVDGTKLRELISEDFNIILLDFNLDNEVENGNNIINTIRDSDVYTEALFYSGQPGFKQHVSYHLDGVFFADREELYERAVEIIYLTVKKNQDINNIRGLVIAEAIDFETTIEEILISYFGINNEKREVFKGIVSPNFHAFTFSRKCDILGRIIRMKIKCLEIKVESDIASDSDLKSELASLKQLKREIISLNKEIVSVRNILAHSKPDPDRKNTLIGINKKKEKITINDEWCIDTRNKMRLQYKNIENLQPYLEEKC